MQCTRSLYIFEREVDRVLLFVIDIGWRHRPQLLWPEGIMIELLSALLSSSLLIFGRLPLRIFMQYETLFEDGADTMR